MLKTNIDIRRAVLMFAGILSSSMQSNHLRFLSSDVALRACIRFDSLEKMDHIQDTLKGVLHVNRS